jgi:hypothetical protein
MALQYTAGSYADFKTFMTNQAFRPDIYYTDIFIPTDPLPVEYQFVVYAIDVRQRILITLFLSGSVEQKPSTFTTDFPGAILLSGGGGVAFVAD